MAPFDTTVWLHPAAEACSGGCAPGGGAAACGTGPVPACLKPELQGDPAVIARVLRALRGVADKAGNLVDAGRFRSLRVGPGEAELVLNFPPGCGASRVLAEDAFQALRHALPDTDVFVLHAK
jgi:hypothetical protein